MNLFTGVVVFDDIKDCDVNVTYDLIEGEFPPPNISGLVVRDPNDLLTSDDLPAKPNFDQDYDKRSEASSSGSKIIGDIQIAEYEGSPRRYRPRASPPQSCEPVPKNGPKRPKLPGFPQRVLPSLPIEEPPAPEKISPVSEELLKFDETNDNNGLGSLGSGLEIKSEAAVKASTASDYESKMRYEFSETRKVLDEFFHKEAEAEPQASAASDITDTSEAIPASATTEVAEIEKTSEDLNYVLRKNNNYVVGQRLASDEAGLNDKDLLLSGITTASAASERPPNTLNIPNNKGHPVVGVSPLDQPLLNFASSTVTSTASEADFNGGNSEKQVVIRDASGLGGHLVPLAQDSRNFTLSPETTDCDSADLESEMSVNEGSFHSSGPKMHTAMPVLEDGLSSGHASDLEDDVIYSR